MYGQSRDQGSDSIPGSRSGPAVFQTSPPSKNKNQRSSHCERQTDPESRGRSGLTFAAAAVGSMVLAVYEIEEEFRAGILLIHEVKLAEASLIQPRPQAGLSSEARKGNEFWLLKVAELRLESEHLPGQALQWKPKIELSSEKMLYTEVLTGKLKSEHVPACQKVLSRLHAVAKMLELSRDRE